MLESYVVSSFIIAFSSLFLGIFTYLKDRSNIVNFMYFVLSVSIAVWSFGFMIATIVAPNKTIALLGARICNFGYILMPVLFLHFVFALLKINKRKKRILYLAYTANFLMLILIFTELYIKGITEPKMVFKYYITPGALYPLGVLMFLTYIGYAYYELFKGYKRSAGIVRNQIKYVLVASVIGFGGGSTVFLPVFNINVYPIGYLFVFLYSVVIAYAIVKHRLLDINIVFKKGAIYAYASFLLLIPLSLLVIYGQKTTFETVSYPFSVSMLSAIILAAYFFPKVKVQAEKTIEQYIFKNKYDYKKTISDLSKAMVSILNTDDLCKKIINTITETMMIEKASIYILNEEKGFYELHESVNLTGDEIVSSYQKDDPIFVWIERHNEIFIREELEKYSTDNEALAMAERMKQMKAETCIPLITKQKLIGVINLGMKSNSVNDFFAKVVSI